MSLGRRGNIDFRGFGDGEKIFCLLAVLVTLAAKNNCENISSQQKQPKNIAERYYSNKTHQKHSEKEMFPRRPEGGAILFYLLAAPMVLVKRKCSGKRTAGKEMIFRAGGQGRNFFVCEGP